MSAHCIRPALDADAEAAVEVLRSSIKEMCIADHNNDGPTLERWLRNKTRERFQAWRSEPDNFMVVADCDGVISGVGAIRQRGDLDLCYVHPAYQKRGIGSAILMALESQAREWGVHRIRLISTRTGRSFYEHCGYVFLPDESSPGFGVLFDYLYTKTISQQAE